MSRLFFATLALAASAGFAGAQSPAPVYAFRATGTTGKLLTSESRDYWAKMGASLKAANTASDKVTKVLGLPAVHAGIAASQSPARKDPAAGQDSEAAVWLGADRRRMAFDSGRH